MKCPCKDCEKRSANCHGKCSDYKEWSSENDKRREKERYERKTAYGPGYMYNRTKW